MESAQYDVIVLGAGAGGMTASAVAAARGLKVLLIEKSVWVGGTTAISGGMVWIPANSKMREAGLHDTMAAVRDYLGATVGMSRSAALDSFLENADRAIAFLEERTSLRFKPVARYPDYYPELPGATLGGRVLEPDVFDARMLGSHFSLLRPPLEAFTLFGGMMVGRTDIPHFRKVMRSVRSAGRVARLCFAYFRQRLRYPRGTTLVLGNALAARLLQSMFCLGVTIKTNARVGRLIMDRGRVTGVTIREERSEQTVLARRAVVLATGGLGHNERLRERYLPRLVKTSASVDSDTGDGIALGLAAGATLREGSQQNGFWVPVSCHRKNGGAVSVFPHTVTDRAKPGLIAVKRDGKRFVNEAVSYHEFVGAMMRANLGDRENPAFLICDSSFIWKYGLGEIKPFTVFLDRYCRNQYLFKGRDIGELAKRAGIDADGLGATLAKYNAPAAEGRDPEFGRGGNAYQRHLGDAEVTPNPCVRPIVTPPFYAIAVFAGDLGTAAGLSTDPYGQVLDGAGQPVEGLYACGNDMASVMEGAYPGPGITLGPALTFGFLIGERVARSR